MAVPKMIRYSVIPVCVSQLISIVRDEKVSRTGMDDVHGTHRTTSIVKHPLLLSTQVLRADFLLQLGDNKIDNGPGVIAVCVDRPLREIVQVLGVKDVELVQARVEVAVRGGEQGEEDGQEAKVLEGEAAAAAARRGLLAAGRLGGHGRGWREWWEVVSKVREKVNLFCGCPLANLKADPREFHLWGSSALRVPGCG